MKNSIFITTSFEGIHAYYGAPQGVGFLREPHRHMFGVKVEMEVFEDDRDVEFILLKRDVNSFYRLKADPVVGVVNCLGKSCEMMAIDLYNYLIDKYPGRSIVITIDEDGENGATYRFMREEKKRVVKNKVCNCKRSSFSLYQENSFKAIQSHENEKDAITHWCLGLTEEAGEVAGAIKHMYYCDEEFDIGKIAEELGDVLWYVSAICNQLEISLEIVAKMNLAKLKHRYQGKSEFDAELNKHRHESMMEFQCTEEWSKLLKELPLKIQKEDK